jgi:hypothetical protein
MMHRVKPPEKPARDVRGKTLILGLIGALFLVVGLLFWAGMTGGSSHVPQGKPGVGFTADDAGTGVGAGSARAGDPAPWDGGVIGATLHD